MPGSRLPGQLGQRDDVDLQHFPDARRIDPVEPAKAAEAGIVDQHIDGQAPAVEFFDETRGAPWRG